MSTILDPYEAYLTASTSFQRMPVQGSSAKTAYGFFDEDRRPLVPMIDTGIMYPGHGGQPGDPSLLKYMYRVRFGGSGKIYIRAMVDDTEVQRGFVTLVDDANQANIFRLPQGTAGYGIRLLMSGIAWWRYFEVDWSPVAETENPE